MNRFKLNKSKPKIIRVDNIVELITNNCVVLIYYKHTLHKYFDCYLSHYYFYFIAGPFDACLAHLINLPALLYNRCIYDSCTSPGDSSTDMACNHIETLATLCSNADVEVTDWRNGTSCCKFLIIWALSNYFEYVF